MLMKVLMCIRKDYLNNFAGDSMQFVKTIEHLKSYNVDIYINNGCISDFSIYDIIHLFNLTVMEETYQYYKRAIMYNKPVVISPIYWDLTRYYNFVKNSYELELWNKWKRYRKEVLLGCKMIYPNSNLEMQVIKKEFGAQLPCTIIYNGIEKVDENMISSDLLNKYKIKDYILCVARICQRKNQLLLAKICNELQLSLVLIGNINNKTYFNSCMEYKNVSYLGFMKSNDINAAYYNARAHILPSFVETPGLSSLEAAVCRCNVISTDEGSAKEYFKNMVTYCNPYKEESISRAIEFGIEKKVDSKLKLHIIEKYSWKECIKVLYESYMKILD